jgi:hypothetical protein
MVDKGDGLLVEGAFFVGGRVAGSFFRVARYLTGGPS